jgi:hypothetical protein
MEIMVNATENHFLQLIFRFLQKNHSTLENIQTLVLGQKLKSVLEVTVVNNEMFFP